MGIQINFNTDELTSEDIAVLGALARSLADPEWAEKAEKPKSVGGRPRKAAPVPKPEPAEEPAEEPVAEEKPAEAPAPKAETAPAPKKAPAKAAEPKPEPAPEPEPAEEQEADQEDATEETPSGEEPKAEAVRRATELVHDGRGTEVRAALKEVDAKKVGDLKGDALEGFLKIVRGL